MTQEWQPGVPYASGAVVTYQGQTYRIIQPHTSQSDWTPSVTPALWGLIPAGDQPPAPLPVQHQPSAPNPPLSPTHTHPHPHMHQPRHATGPLEAVGAAADAWLGAARQRTEAFFRDGPRAPTTWVLVESGRDVPHGAVKVPRDDGEPLLVFRVHHEGAERVVSFVPLHSGPYEVLLGDARAIRWVPASGKLRDPGPGVWPVEAGHAADGTPIYVARVHNGNEVYVGQSGPSVDGALVHWKGEDRNFQEYSFLSHLVSRPEPSRNVANRDVGTCTT